MSRNLSHALWACPPYWNTVSLHPTVVAYCTVRYGTGVQESVCTVLNIRMIENAVPNDMCRVVVYIGTAVCVLGACQHRGKVNFMLCKEKNLDIRSN